MEGYRAIMEPTEIDVKIATKLLCRTAASTADPSTIA